jgi:hypothetical protein
MIPTDVKKCYGEEYPAVMIKDGIRGPLHRESRFSRIYHSNERNTSYGFSRFMDGSASITAVDLERDWASWTKDLQIDFCQQCSSLFDQFDFPEMLRFVMKHGSLEHWAAIALTVAYHLPQQEAFDFLVRALRAAKDNARAANMMQAIAATKHPDAEAMLRSHLAATWANPTLWDNANSLNSVAYDASACITRLIELGALPADFAEQVQRLSQHVCSRNRVTCRRHFSKHYPEINIST